MSSTLSVAVLFAISVASSPFPAGPKPAREILYVDLVDRSQPERFLFYALQGLVNRTRPRIWIKNDRYEFTVVPDYWRAVLEEKGFRFKPVTQPWSLIGMFRDEYKGAVLYDGDIGADEHKKIGLNALASLCGVLDALPLTPEMNQNLKLPVLLDTRPIFTDTRAILSFAEKDLLARCTKKLVHHSPPGVFLENTDYIVAHRIFSFFAAGELDKEDRSIYDRFLSYTKPNTPVIGVWAQDDRCPPPRGFMDELGFVDWLSSFGKFMVVTHSCGNLTVHTALKSSNLKQKRTPCPVLEKAKIYVTFILSDGDNAAGCMQLRPRIWGQSERGSIPVGWNWGPSLRDLFPLAADFFAFTSTERDVPVAACTGYGYITPERFADRFDAKSRKAIWNDYLNLTSKSMKRQDLDLIWPWWCSWETAESMAKNLPGLKAMYLNAYPVDDAPSNGFRYLGSSVLAIQNQTAADIVEPVALCKSAQKALEAWKGKRPAFLFLGVNGFMVDYPKMRRVVESLGQGAIVVRPDHFAELYRQAYPPKP